MSTMTPESFWLVLTAAMTGVLWIPYIVNRVTELGPPPMVWHPAPDPPPKAQWATRAVCAHVNAVENLAVFAPFALAVHVTASGKPVTAAACMIYFFARAAHYLIRILGMPIPFRTVAFFIGFVAQMVLAATLIGLP